jgi:hypothetical protein
MYVCMYSYGNSNGDYFMISAENEEGLGKGCDDRGDDGRLRRELLAIMLGRGERGMMGPISGGVPEK